MSIKELGTVLRRIVSAVIISILLVWVISALGSALLPSAKGFFTSIFSTTVVAVTTILIYLGLEDNSTPSSSAKKAREVKEAAWHKRINEREAKIQEKVAELAPEMKQEIIDTLKADPGRHFSGHEIRNFFSFGNDEASRRALNLAMGYFWQHPNSEEGIKRHMEPQGGLREPIDYYYYEAK